MAKTAIVTGGSRGIGKAVSKRLAADGFFVVVNYAGNAAEAEKTVQEIVAAGGKATAIQADVAEEGQVKALFEKAKAEYGTIAVVVNCAGVMSLSPIGKGDLNEFDRIIRTNLRGTYIVLGQAAQHVAEGGRIIAFSTSVIAKAFPGYGAYIASKAGVEGLVHVLANELRGKKITVNAVAPGPVATELFFQGKSKEQIESLTKLPPLERLAEPQDIAGVVSFLAGPDGGWVNYQVVRANGGFA